MLRASPPVSRHPQRRRGARLAAVLLALPLHGAGSCTGAPALIGLPTLAGLLPIQVPLSAGTDPASVTVTLDGVDVTGAFAPGGPGLVGALPVPDPGEHRLQVTRPFVLPVGSITTGMRFQSPTAAPAVLLAEPDVLDIEPRDGSGNVPSGAWLRVRLAAPAAASDLEGFGFALECDGARVARTAHVQDDGALIRTPRRRCPRARRAA
jgi:hypothetical protein